ncbi:hypothetical protein N9I00_01715 [bacterium]|jgi:hypothetical protein|nr:hypothetical protein [bacterium]
MEFILKSIIGGIIIASVVTVAQRGNPTLGALILGIPLTSVVSILFMYYSGVDIAVFSQLAKETIIFVLVSLVFFPLFVLLVKNIAFLPALSISLFLTMTCLYILKIYLES